MSENSQIEKQFRLRAVHHVHSELLPLWGLSGLISKYKKIVWEKKKKTRR
jgi:hypothetical protein